MYKLIGFDAGKIHEAVADLLPTGRYMLSFSNFSARGKYICLNLNTVVQSENERNDLFNELKAHQDIRMVL